MRVYAGTVYAANSFLFFNFCLNFLFLFGCFYLFIYLGVSVAACGLSLAVAHRRLIVVAALMARGP